MNMKVSATENFAAAGRQNRFSFKGYDARALKGIVMSINDEPKSFGIIKEMAQIGKKEGFGVYFAASAGRLCSNINSIKKYFEHCVSDFSKWAQDLAVSAPDNRILYFDKFNDSMRFAKKLSSVNKAKNSGCGNLVEGGNLFFVKNCEKNELFVGANELRKNNPDTLKDIYGVSKVIAVPQADFHLDMFMRPLNNKKILVADDRLTLLELKRAVESIEKYKTGKNCAKSEINELEGVKNGLKTLLKNFSKNIKENRNPTAEEIAHVLKNNGYSPVFVPGRVYYTIKGDAQDDLIYSLNYLNAIVHQKPDGSLVFVTNKSRLNDFYGITPEISEKIGFDFEKMFVESLKPHIKKENIHFIDAENKMANLLETEGGGIHCLCCEIPEIAAK